VGRKIVVEIVNDRPRNYYFKDSISNEISYDKSVEVDEDNIDLSKLDCYVYSNNELKIDTVLLEAKKNNEKSTIKSYILRDLEIAKRDNLNQEIEIDVQIDGNNEKVKFINSELDRRMFMSNLVLMKILNKNKFKIKVRKSDNKIIFIETTDDIINKISDEIYNNMEQVELIEQTVLQGLDKYTLEQLKDINVYDYFRQ
jgi:hypothetical protein